MYRQTQVGIFRVRLRPGAAGLEALGRAMKPLANAEVLILVTECAQQVADFIRPSPRGLHELQTPVKRDPTGLRILQDTALKDSALPRPITINATAAIGTQRRARLREASDWR